MSKRMKREKIQPEVGWVFVESSSRLNFTFVLTI